MANDTVLPAYVSLGSNQGDSESILRNVIELLASGQSSPPQQPLRLGACSSLYVTEPQLYTDQPFFLNQVVRLDCSPDYSPFDLLAYLQSLEQELGRVRTGPRYGPRVIDLDILLFGHAAVHTDVLTIPHARMYERAFVLVPLAEVAPDLILPDGHSIQSHLRNISYSVAGNVILQNSPETSL